MLLCYLPARIFGCIVGPGRDLLNSNCPVSSCELCELWIIIASYCIAAMNRELLYCELLYCELLYCELLYCELLYCELLYYELHCVVSCCIVSCCIVSCCIVSYIVLQP